MDLKQLEKSAMKMLSMREHSYHELHKKLVNKADDYHDVKPLLIQLIKDNFLSEERFTEVFIHSHKNKGKGPTWILNKLKEHQIQPNLISRHLDIDEDDWIDCALGVKNKKFGDDNVEDFEEKMKQARFLKYRGFTHFQIFKVLDRKLKN